MSRPSTEPATHEQPRKPGKEPPRLACEHYYLLVAAVTGTTTLAVWLYDVYAVLNNGLVALLCTVSAVSACGYLVRSAEARVIRRIDQRIDQMATELVAEEVRKDHEAEEYVDDMRSRTAKRLQSI